MGWNPPPLTGVDPGAGEPDQTKLNRYVHIYPVWTVTYTDGVDGEEIFEDQVYENLAHNAVTPSFDGAPAREGYTFAGWDPELADNVTEDVTYTAQWIKNSASDPAPNPSDPPAPSAPPAENVTVPIGGEGNSIEADVSVNGNKATIDEVDLSNLDNTNGSDEEDADTVTIDFSGIDTGKPITTVELPADVIKQIAEAVNDTENDAQSLEIVLSNGTSIEFDAEALGEKAAQADGKDITVSIEDAKPNKKQEAALNGRPAYDITVTSGGEELSDMGGQITVHVPYELQDGEQPKGIVVCYVDDEGNLEFCQTDYDPVEKKVSWKTDSMSDSMYVIGYCQSAVFDDLNMDAWYHEAADFVIENGLMNGVSGNKFDPNGVSGRNMIVTILWRLEGSPVVNYLMDFEDVENDQWYTEAVRWAASEKIVEGIGNGLFGTNNAITREQLITIMYRYAQYKGIDVSVGENTNILSYGDAFDVSEWAIPAMQWACGAGIIEGIEEGDTFNLHPQGTATRAQVAAILQRFCEYIAK